MKNKKLFFFDIVLYYISLDSDCKIFIYKRESKRVYRNVLTAFINFEIIYR